MRTRSRKPSRRACAVPNRCARAASLSPPPCIFRAVPAALEEYCRCRCRSASKPKDCVVMAELDIRKTLIAVEEIFHEGGPVAARPLRRGVALAVIRNPFAGRYVEEIQAFMEDLKPLGLHMATHLIEALGGARKAIEGYGKGAIVGAAGEIEHGALWHVPGGYAMREVLGGAHGIVPSTKKGGGPGTRRDVAVTHVNASYVRSHFDTVEVGLADAPRSDEMVLALVMTTGPRVHARVGGLKASEIKGEDGHR